MAAYVKVAVQHCLACMPGSKPHIFQRGKYPRRLMLLLLLACPPCRGASAFAQLGGAAPQQVSSAGALGPAHMLGAAAVMQQLAQQAWQQVQQRAQQDVKIVEQAAARGLEAAAEKLADVAQPVDGTDQLPGPSPVQLFWEVGSAACTGSVERSAMC
jgi:hypothetical protein